MLPVRCKRARRCKAELLQNDEAESGGVGVNDSYMDVLQQYEGETLNVRRGRRIICFCYLADIMECIYSGLQNVWE